MKSHHISVDSTNASNSPKPITALILSPDEVNSDTGVMLFTHGWGGNRFQHEDKAAWTVERHNVVAVCVEYRQSGYDFDATRGTGWTCPYDASHYQVFDVLNVLRHVLAISPHLSRRRLYHYGGSQGGQVALLCAIYAPATFAWTYVSCPVTHLDEQFQSWAGRCFAPHELSARNVLEHAGRIRCPIYLEYGDSDTTVSAQNHIFPLVEHLRATGHLAHLIAYSGGGHDLKPTTNKLQAYQAMAEHLPWDCERDGNDDFESGSTVEIPCDGYRLRVDWSKPADSADVIKWVDTGKS